MREPITLIFERPDKVQTGEAHHSVPHAVNIRVERRIKEAMR